MKKKIFSDKNIKVVMVRKRGGQRTRLQEAAYKYKSLFKNGSLGGFLNYLKTSNPSLREYLRTNPQQYQRLGLDSRMPRKLPSQKYDPDTPALNGLTIVRESTPNGKVEPPTSLPNHDEPTMARKETLKERIQRMSQEEYKQL